MKSRKLLILAVSILSIIGIGVYSQFLNELEDIPIQEEQKYLPIVINDETTLYEIHKIDGKNLIKYATTNLFNIFSSVEDLTIVYDELSTKKGLFKLKSNVGSVFSQIKISDEENKPLVIVPIFTASAYAENGFYEFFKGWCDTCTTTKIVSIEKLDYNSSANAVQVLKLLGYDSITDIELDQNPNLIAKYNKIIILHNEYVTKNMFNAITSHPNVIYLYPNALYAEINVDYEKNEITLIKGHNYPESEIINGFEWEYENTHPYEYDSECENWEFYDIHNGKMLNCYPEYRIFQDELLLKTLKEL
ncbi:MAG: hypothetical protein OSA03_01325 [Nitrosopumilus sp.]|nr:hypothetical protein [Nitrosopumilus sp.]